MVTSGPMATSLRPRLADLVRVAGVASFIWALVEGQWVNAALFSLVLLGLVLPRFLGTAPLLDLGYGVVLLFAAWSAVLDLYVRFNWLDVLVHAVACGTTTFFAHRFLVAWSILPRHQDPGLRRAAVGVVLTTTALGWALGLLWELGEWFGHTYLDERIQVGYGDTIGDLVADGLGAAAVGLLIARRTRPPRPDGPPPGADIPVSVVIPVRDDATALAHCLELVRQQTVSAFEVVVVDNGSSDDSAAVALRYGARVVSESTVGIPAASAAGYDAARGEVIARCDADSRPPPDWLERIVGRMAAEPDLDGLTGSGRFYGVPRLVEPLVRRVYLSSYYVLVHASMGHTPLWGSNMALRRSVWGEVSHLVHREDSELHDDMDLSFVLGPTRQLRYDRRLVVGVSARSLRGSEQLRRRMRRAVRTLQENWEVLPPWTRWRTRLELGPTGAAVRTLRGTKPREGRAN